MIRLLAWHSCTVASDQVSVSVVHSVCLDPSTACNHHKVRGHRLYRSHHSKDCGTQSAHSASLLGTEASLCTFQLLCIPSSTYQRSSRSLCASKGPFRVLYSNESTHMKSLFLTYCKPIRDQGFWPPPSLYHHRWYSLVSNRSAQCRILSSGTVLGSLVRWLFLFEWSKLDLISLTLYTSLGRSRVRKLSRNAIWSGTYPEA